MTHIDTPYTLAITNGWQYIGDVNLYHGGTFIRVSDCRNYADVVEFIDASNAGHEYDDKVWIITATVPIDNAGKRRIRSALDVCGRRVRSPEWLAMSRDDRASEIAYCLYVYGYNDSDPHTEIDSGDATCETASAYL